MAGVCIGGLQNVSPVPTGESEGSRKSPAYYVSIRHVILERSGKDHGCSAATVIWNYSAVLLVPVLDTGDPA